MPLHYGSSVFYSLNFKDGFVVAVDSTTGRPDWAYRCADCYVSPPVIYEDLLFVSSRDNAHGTGKVRAINIATGKEEWSISAGDKKVSLISPTVFEGMLFFMLGEGASDILLAQGSYGSIHAVDISTRSIKWSFEAQGIFDTPAIWHGFLYAGSNRDYLYALDINTGKLKWKFKAKAHAPVVRDGTVYFNDYANLFAVDAETGQLKWKNKAPASVETMLAVTGSAIFFGGDSGAFYAVNTNDGKLKWRTKIKGTPYEPIIANNRVLAGGTEELLMLDLETGKNYSEIALGPNRVSTPSLGDGYMIVANDDGFFFAIR